MAKAAKKRRVDVELEEKEPKRYKTTSFVAAEYNIDSKCATHRPGIEVLIRERLSFGKYGDVYAACVESLNQTAKDPGACDLVVKVIRSDDTMREAVLREATAMKSAREVDPTLVPRLVDAWTCPMLDQEGKKLVRGFLLLERVRDLVPSVYWLEPDQVVPRLGHLIRGLLALHKQGWVHGDVHANNVLLPRHEPTRVRLIDFGAAVRMGSNEEAKASSETLAQLAAKTSKQRDKPWSWLAQFHSDWIPLTQTLTSEQQKDIFDACSALLWSRVRDWEEAKASGKKLNEPLTTGARVEYDVSDDDEPIQPSQQERQPPEEVSALLWCCYCLVETLRICFG